MPRIVLNRATTNSAIPMVPVLGFSDSFNRADNASSLGVTAGGKPWVFVNGTWGIVSNAAKYNNQNAFGYALTDASTPNGTLSATMKTIGSARAGVMLRYIDDANFIRVYFSANNVANPYFQHYENGTLRNKFPVAGTKAVMDGSVVSVVADGPTLTIKVDGVTVLSDTTPNLTGTRHGLVGTSTGVDTTFDAVAFTAA